MQSMKFPFKPCYIVREIVQPSRRGAQRTGIQLYHGLPGPSNNDGDTP